MERAASKSQWTIDAPGRILTSPLCHPANNMIELRSNCGWKALVHKPLLCHYSTYYEAAIYGKFQEASSNHFDLRLNKPYAEWFVRWLYSGKLSGPDANTGTEELFQLYIFADEKDILALRRDVMTRLVQYGLDDLLDRDIALATNSLPPSAPLYKFAVEWYINHWYHIKSNLCQQQDQEYENFPKEFMYLAMCGLSERAQHGNKPTFMWCQPCRFHEHESYHERLSTCLFLGNMESYDCPEELRPSQHGQTST